MEKFCHNWLNVPVLKEYLYFVQWAQVSGRTRKTKQKIYFPNTLIVSPHPSQSFDMISLSQAAFYKEQLSAQDDFFLVHTCRLLQ